MLWCDLLLLQSGTGSSACNIFQYVCRCAESWERRTVLHRTAGFQTALGQMVSVLNMGFKTLTVCWLIHQFLLQSVQAWIKTVSVCSRPYMRGSVSQELSRIWLQENVDPTAKKHQGWKKGNCAQQVLCAHTHVIYCLPVYEFESYVVLYVQVGIK